VIKSIRQLAESFDEVEKVNELLTMHMGPDFVLVNISIRFKRGKLTRELETVIQEIDGEIKAKHETVKRIFVEAEAN
jgi:divalent metal cation (Fe/Co/Zn/Cd) transporter